MDALTIGVIVAVALVLAVTLIILHRNDRRH